MKNNSWTNKVIRLNSTRFFRKPWARIEMNMHFLFYSRCLDDNYIQYKNTIEKKVLCSQFENCNNAIIEPK